MFCIHETFPNLFDIVKIYMFERLIYLFFGVVFLMLLINNLVNDMILLKLNVGALEIFANQKIQRCQSLSLF